MEPLSADAQDAMRDIGAQVGLMNDRIEDETHRRKSLFLSFKFLSIRWFCRQTKMDLDW